MAGWEGWTSVKARQEANLADEHAQQAFEHFNDTILIPLEAADRLLSAKLLACDAWKPGPKHQMLARQIRSAHVVPGSSAALKSTIARLSASYWKTADNVSVWVDRHGITPLQLDELRASTDRRERERAWRLEVEGWLQQREHLDALFLELLAARRRLAREAGFPDFRSYFWAESAVVDYSPKDCLAYHDAIESEVLPLAAERQRTRAMALRLASLRPWDLNAGLGAGASPRPFDTVGDFEQGMANLFSRVDPELGSLFDRMRFGFLDLGWRPGKRGGGSERPFPLTGVPYVFLCADGTLDGAGSLMHEMGHAFHDHRTMAGEPLAWHLEHSDAFSEVAAFSMYYLAAPYLGSTLGGPLPDREVTRSQARFMEEVITQFLPGLALSDAFQHWIYAEAPDNVHPADIDRKWVELRRRFLPWDNRTGLDAETAIGWQRNWSLFTQPFYDFNYALAHVGALHVWRNAQHDRAAAWEQYRRALSLGNTRPLSALYRAAGAEIPFKRRVLRETIGTLSQWLSTGPSAP